MPLFRPGAIPLSDTQLFITALKKTLRQSNQSLIDQFFRLEEWPHNGIKVVHDLCVGKVRRGLFPEPEKFSGQARRKTAMIQRINGHGRQRAPGVFLDWHARLCRGCNEAIDDICPALRQVHELNSRGEFKETGLGHS